MFERYLCPRVVARFRASPDADWLSSFLELLARNRYSRLTILVYIREAELFGIWMRSHRHRLAQVTESVVRKFVTRLMTAE